MMLLFQSTTNVNKNAKEIVTPFPTFLAAVPNNVQGGFRKETRDVSIFNYSKSSGSLYFWMASEKGKIKDPKYSLAYESLVDLYGSSKDKNRFYLDFSGMELSYTNSKGEEVTINKVIMGELIGINADVKKGSGEGYTLTLKHGTRESEVYTIDFSNGTVTWKSGIEDSGSEIETFSINEVGPDESRKSASIYLLDENGEKIKDLTENQWKHIFALAKRRNELAKLLEKNNRQIVIGGEGFRTGQTELNFEHIKSGGRIERVGDKYVLKLKNDIEMNWSDLQSIIDSIKKTDTSFDLDLKKGSVGGNDGGVIGYAYFISKDNQGIAYVVTGAAYKMRLIDGTEYWYSRDEIDCTK